MSNVGFEIQLKDNTIFYCNVSYVPSPAQYTIGKKKKKKKLEVEGKITLKL
jgi:hypothetical protein